MGRVYMGGKAVRDDVNILGGNAHTVKEGVLRIFSPLKIQCLRPGLNLRTSVLKANTLPLDH